MTVLLVLAGLVYWAWFMVLVRRDGGRVLRESTPCERFARAMRRMAPAIGATLLPPVGRATRAFAEFGRALEGIDRVALASAGAVTPGARLAVAALAAAEKEKLVRAQLVAAGLCPDCRGSGIDPGYPLECRCGACGGSGRPPEPSS